MKFLNQALLFSVLMCSGFSHCAELSPYGTGFSLGSNEDLEIRFEWAKKDQCFKHGFHPASREALELKKYWSIKNGPNSSPPKCKNSKTENVKN